MESKQNNGKWLYDGWDAFNRTSMESKHYSRLRLAGGAAELLIEPVWNRNAIRAGVTEQPISF